MAVPGRRLNSLYSRRIVGWAMGDSLERHLVIAALQMAIKMRSRPQVCCITPGKGSQYASATIIEAFVDPISNAL
ncbi:MAG: hypothetical protein U0401_20935 [Anaerolineae bacterium]